jgi:hypothetical protein
MRCLQPFFAGNLDDGSLFAPTFNDGADDTGQGQFRRHVHGATILKLLDKMVFRRPFHVGKPVSVEERKRHAAAEVQREMRREMEQRFAEIRSGSWRTRCQHAADIHLLHI